MSDSCECLAFGIQCQITIEWDMTWVGNDLKDHLLPWAGTPLTRAGVVQNKTVFILFKRSFFLPQNDKPVEMCNFEGWNSYQSGPKNYFHYIY